MRQVTRNAAQAFLGGRSGTFGNTSVSSHVDGDRYVYLHGNKIAQTNDNGETLYVTLAGWPTPTTRERVNGLLELFCTNTPPIPWPLNAYNPPAERELHPRPGYYQHKRNQWFGTNYRNDQTEVSSLDWICVHRDGAWALLPAGERP